MPELFLMAALEAKVELVFPVETERHHDFQTHAVGYILTHKMAARRLLMSLQFRVAYKAFW